MQQEEKGLCIIINLTFWNWGTQSSQCQTMQNQNLKDKKILKCLRLSSQNYLKIFSDTKISLYIWSPARSLVFFTQVQTVYTKIKYIRKAIWFNSSVLLKDTVFCLRPVHSHINALRSPSVPVTEDKQLIWHSERQSWKLLRSQWIDSSWITRFTDKNFAPERKHFNLKAVFLKGLFPSLAVCMCGCAVCSDICT